jgi:hypothetical protein
LVQYCCHTEEKGANKGRHQILSYIIDYICYFIICIHARLAQSDRASDSYGSSEGCEFDPRGGLTAPFWTSISGGTGTSCEALWNSHFAPHTSPLGPFSMTSPPSGQPHIVSLVLQSKKALQHGEQLCARAHALTGASARSAVDALALDAKVRWVISAVLQQFTVRPALSL